jgi:hypothetical protein
VLDIVDLYQRPPEIGLFSLEAHGRASQEMAWSGAGRHTRFTKKVEMQGFAQREMTTINEMWLELVRWLAQEAVNQG